MTGARAPGGSAWIGLTHLLLPGTAYQVVGLLNRVDYGMAVGGGFPLLGVWTLFVAPLVALAIPQLRFLALGGSRFGRWAVPLATAVAAVVVFGWGMVTSGFDAEHPRPNSIAYELDAGAGRARWVSLDPELDEWTTQFFPNGASLDEYEVDAGVMAPALVTPAPMATIDLVSVNVVDDTVADGVRTVTFRLESPREAAQLDVGISGGSEITRATINGIAVDLGDYEPAREGTLTFGYAGVPRSGVEVTLEVTPVGPLQVEVAEMTYGLPTVPGMAIVPLTAKSMPATGIPLDTTMVRKTFTI